MGLFRSSVFILAVAGTAAQAAEFQIPTWISSQEFGSAKTYMSNGIYDYYPQEQVEFSWDLQQNCLRLYNKNLAGVNDWYEYIYCNHQVKEYDSKSRECRGKPLPTQYQINFKQMSEDYFSGFTNVISQAVGDPLEGSGSYKLVKHISKDSFVYVRANSVEYIVEKGQGSDFDYVVHFNKGGLAQSTNTNGVSDFHYQVSPCG